MSNPTWSISVVNTTADQHVAPGQVFAELLTVVLIDATTRDPIRNKEVSFVVHRDGADKAVTPQLYDETGHVWGWSTVAVTDSIGHAKVQARAGTARKSFEVHASADNTNGVDAVFTLTADGAAPVAVIDALKIVGGDLQVLWSPDTLFPVPLVVRALKNGQPVQGAEVAFSSTDGITFPNAGSNPKSVSNAQGEVNIQATAGPTSGVQKVQATCQGRSVEFQLTHGPDPRLLYWVFTPAEARMPQARSATVTVQLQDSNQRPWPITGAVVEPFTGPFMVGPPAAGPNGTMVLNVAATNSAEGGETASLGLQLITGHGNVRVTGALSLRVQT